MRKTIGDALFSRTQQSLLKIFFLEPGRRFYLSDLAKRLNVAPSSLQRTVAAFYEAGVLDAEREGRQIYYRVNQHMPVFKELQSLVRKSFGGPDLVRERLEALAPKIRVAFIYGSFARGEEKSQSDLDVMLVGSVTLSEVAKALRGLEGELGREINPTVYTPEELKRKKATSFIKTVLASEKLPLVGEISELDKIVS